jgi:hypothetical protein
VEREVGFEEQFIRQEQKLARKRDSVLELFPPISRTEIAFWTRSAFFLPSRLKVRAKAV